MLRQRTASTHAELENMPFGQSLAAGTIDRVTYSDYLRATATLVASLRTDIRRHGMPMHQPFLDTLETWTQLLEADIRSIGPEDGVANSGARQAALDLVQELRCRLVDDPAWVIGMIYVLFGSHNGNRYIADAVTRGLSLAGGTGTGYLRATCNSRQLWPESKLRIDRVLDNEPLLENAVNGALATFAGFRRIFDAMEGDATRKPHASAVNPEAGNHPVVANDAFRAIATRAGTQCHNAFGYLVRRYRRPRRGFRAQRRCLAGHPGRAVRGRGRAPGRLAGPTVVRAGHTERVPGLSPGGAAQ
ncbi:MAG: biliverdin-producing heme oxygenase [Woeseiaceae bacterium]|nr:biliverdin-producing heme oxygenase [Woeseiaceae bacterium]